MNSVRKIQKVKCEINNKKHSALKIWFQLQDTLTANLARLSSPLQYFPSFSPSHHHSHPSAAFFENHSDLEVHHIRNSCNLCNNFWGWAHLFSIPPPCFPLSSPPSALLRVESASVSGGSASQQSAASPLPSQHWDMLKHCTASTTDLREKPNEGNKLGIFPGKLASRKTEDLKSDQISAAFPSPKQGAGQVPSSPKPAARGRSLSLEQALGENPSCPASPSLAHRWTYHHYMWTCHPHLVKNASPCFSGTRLRLQRMRRATSEPRWVCHNQPIDQSP